MLNNQLFLTPKGLVLVEKHSATALPAANIAPITMVEYRHGRKAREAPVVALQQMAQRFVSNARRGVSSASARRGVSSARRKLQGAVCPAPVRARAGRGRSKSARNMPSVD